MTSTFIAAFLATAKFTPAKLDNGKFSFTLNENSVTSVGIYNDNDQLIRTLWSGRKDKKGVHLEQWDGLLDDELTLAPYANYKVKVLANNVEYSWLGVIGNSSTSHFENQILTPFHSMACTNGYMYIASGYAERDIKTNKLSLSDIGSIYNAVDPTQSLTQTMWAEYICTNGTYVFWGGGDPYSSAKSFIFASNPVDDSQVIFTNGQQVTIGIDGRQYHSALIQSTTDQILTVGLTASTDFLFASRCDTNVVEVYDLRDNSGALIQSLSLGANTTALACYSGYLWASVNSNVKQFNINSDGSLTATGVIINVNTGQMAISPSGELAVADKDNQQLKFFDVQTGVQTYILGQAGGYDLNGPTVTNDKFMFYGKANGATAPALAYQSDGSLWLSDCGNYRILHFNANKTFKEKISYVPTSRSCTVDENSPTSVFADALEYQVDYSKVATDINNSWTLKYNWNVGTTLNIFGQFEQVVTLNNGHKYAVARLGDNINQLYDLRPTGAMLVGHIPQVEAVIEADGSLYSRSANNSQQLLITKYLLTGFDSNFMPQWDGGTVIHVVDPQGTNNPYDYGNNVRGASTNANRYFFYQPNIFPGGGAVIYHLGSVKKGHDTAEWMTSKSTSYPYRGTYPTDGYYAMDGGHSENCLANVNGSNVFWHINDELGFYTEVSRTNHYHEDGLFIGHFGTDNYTVGLTGDTNYWAGNSFKTQLAKVGNDLYYFYCDESKHGGVHIVKVGNLASIQEQVMPVVLNSSISLVPDSSDLMAGITFEATSFGSAPGWLIEAGTPSIRTGVRQYLKELVDIEVSGNTGQRIVSRYLGNSQLSTYTLSGLLCFAESQLTFGDFHVYNILGLYDTDNKQMVLLYLRSDGVYANNTLIAQYNSVDANFFRSFTFLYTDSILSINFADHAPVIVSSTWDLGADISKPGFLKIVQYVIEYRSDNTVMSLSNLKFKTT